MKEQRPTNPIAIGAAIALVILTACAGAYFLFWKGPKEVAGATKDGVIEGANEGYILLKKFGGDLHKALQFEPKVTIGSTVVHGPPTEVTELVTASQTFEQTYTYAVSWAGSSKNLELKGDFAAKAGFPIDDSFSLGISEDGKTVTVRHGAPRIISCELTKLHILKDEDGWWNKIQPKERESAQNELLRKARLTARESGLLETATKDLHERLAPLSDKYSFDTKFEVIP